MIYTDISLRPSPNYPTYPPYHKGDYLEDYFYNRFTKERPKTVREYIGISWTTLYCDNKDQNLQSFLDSLDANKKYFTVMQHDDAPKHRLPKDTICFSAGGNVRGENIIPIPLICSKLLLEDIEKVNKTILASFVGSLTHNIRHELVKYFYNKSDCEIHVKNWTPYIEHHNLNLFIETALKSKFLLCPRGYGLNSFRLYEAFQLGCVPVIITDIPYLPWNDELNWFDFSIIADKNQIQNLYNTLHSISDEKYYNLLKKGSEIYNKYFTLDGMYKNILKRLYNGY
jgi:hypothetical protein